MTSAAQDDALQPRTWRTMLHGEQLWVVSQAGLPAWDRITPATTLLADSVQLTRDAQVLLLGCGHGALAVALARQAPLGRITALDQSAVALTMTAQTAQRNKIATIQVLQDIAPGSGLQSSIDVVVIEPPE